jgi:hypothetical protein
MMRTHREILLIALLLVSCVRVGEAETGPELIPLPDRLVVGRTTYEIVVRPSPPPALHARLPSAYRFPKGPPIKHLNESLQYGLEGHEFLQSPNGKFALPYEGSGSFFGYIDLARQDFIDFKARLTPMGEGPETGRPGHYQWAGVLDQSTKPPTTLWLFVRHWDGKRNVFSSQRMTILLDHPESTQVDMMEQVVVEQVFAQAENELLCQIIEGVNRNWARLSTQTWTLLAQGKLSRKYGHLGWAGYTPGQREIYAVYSGGGLVIFDAENGHEQVHHRTVGHFSNAFTFGASFDPGGSVAVVSTPYQQKITLIDVKTQQIVAEYKSAFPLAGILFDGKERKAYAYQTFLPYE